MDNKMVVKINVNGTNANAQYEMDGWLNEWAIGYKEHEIGDRELTYTDAKTVLFI